MCLEFKYASKLHAQVFCIFKLGAMQGSRLIRGTFAQSSVKFAKEQIVELIAQHDVFSSNKFTDKSMLHLLVHGQNSSDNADEGHKAFVCTNLSRIEHSKKRPVCKLCVRLNLSYQQTAIAFCNPQSLSGVLSSQCEYHYRSSISYTILPC